MARAEPLAANPIAARVFAPILRDWERPIELLRILAENIVLIVAALLFSHWLSPNDPFGIDAQFPWIWIVPMLLALRYGTIDGVLGAGLMLAAWLLPQPWGMSGGPNEPAFPQEYFWVGSFWCWWPDSSPMSGTVDSVVSVRRTPTSMNALFR